MLIALSLEHFDTIADLAARIKLRLLNCKDPQMVLWPVPSEMWVCGTNDVTGLEPKTFMGTYDKSVSVRVLADDLRAMVGDDTTLRKPK